MKKVAIAACAIMVAAGTRSARSADADFPHLPIYDNPFKTPEQEQDFAHSAAMDWGALTIQERSKCLRTLNLPAIPFSSDVDLRNAPPNTYERLELCTSMEINSDAVTGKPNSWITTKTDVASLPSFGAK